MTYTWRGYSSATPMPYDFLALQYLYGARAHWSSDDRFAYTAHGADQSARAGSLYLETPYRVKQTLWDTGGTNTLDFSALPDTASGYRIDLRELGWSSALSDYISGVAELPYAHFLTGTALAPGVRIARVVNSSSSDAIYAGNGRHVRVCAGSRHGGRYHLRGDGRRYTGPAVLRTRRGRADTGRVTTWCWPSARPPAASV